ncbi:DUF167 domain-containing protein [Thiorhodococcus minor]|uniref:UPF0235 protein G3446_06650 n=1 Tax=Thiorhodococcus minor TaxID=57489 RepID=A0A6M0JX82_9GAMM|nr:DUF167 family protein [Thiorhodococcus minor]NEV61571.1 YggU family protein [Thiorhodococcus minor]
MSWYRWKDDDLELSLRVQPRAPKDAWQGPDPSGGHYRVRIKAPPVDGKGNEALQRFVAKSFGVAPSKVEILGGEHARYKRLRIQAPKAFPIEVDRE